jgi:hypothetical protein
MMCKSMNKSGTVKIPEVNVKTSVAYPDPDPPDPHVFGPPGSGSGPNHQRYGSDPSITKQK